MYPDWTVCTAKIRQKVLLGIRNNLCYKVLHRAPECDSNAVLEHSAAQQSLQEVGSGYLSLLGSDSHVIISKASQPSLHSGDVRQRECLKEHQKKAQSLSVQGSPQNTSHSDYFQLLLWGGNLLCGADLSSLRRMLQPWQKRATAHTVLVSLSDVCRTLYMWEHTLPWLLSRMGTAGRQNKLSKPHDVGKTE